jgi:hypothetical protein
MLLLGVVLLGAACTRAGRHGEVREQHGDTLVVRTLAGSQWGDSVRLVPELRFGALEGQPEYVFGIIDHLAVGPDGRMYVFDRAYRSLRVYDARGQFVRTIGRTGSGPGEYGEVDGLELLSDGRLVLWDYGNSRINLYSPEGAFLASWRVRSGLRASQTLMVDSADRIYVKTVIGMAPGAPWRFGLLRFDHTGAFLDSIPAPYWPDAPSGGGYFLPSQVFTWHPGGYFVAGRSDRYAIDVQRPGGVLRIERAVAPVALESAEWDEYEAFARQAAARTQKRHVPTPRVKPAFGGFVASKDGRLWVLRQAKGVRIAPEEVETKPGELTQTWRQQREYDVFDRDGHYLGRVPIPDRTRLEVMRGDTVWGVTRGEMDEPYVVRFRIERSNR